MVLTKGLASRVLHRNLTELILLASQDNNNKQSYNVNTNTNNKPFQQQPSSVIKIKVPDSIDIIEAVIPENISSSSFRSNGKLIITDGRNLVFFPPELEEEGEQESKFAESIKRPLRTCDVEDRKIIKKLIEKALDISIKKVTGLRMMQGIYLLEEPISLYRCERAKLYLGFSVRVNLKEEEKERG
jgi:hypothetical protein